MLLPVGIVIGTLELNWEVRTILKSIWPTLHQNFYLSHILAEALLTMTILFAGRYMACLPMRMELLRILVMASHC